MNIDQILEILKYILPALVAVLAVWVIITRNQKQEEFRQKVQLALENKKVTLPIRLQAYERLTLLLERINPDSLLIREYETNQSAQQLQMKLLAAIRNEFDHNLSQQIYCSPKVWAGIKYAREDLSKTINSAFMSLPTEAGASELNRKILEIHHSKQNNPLQGAIDQLKSENRILF